MQNIGSQIATWLGILGTIVGAAMGYAKLKQTVAELKKKSEKTEETADLKQAELVKLETKLEELEKRQEEDRVSAHRNFDRFFTAQNELSNVLREVSTVLDNLNNNFENRINRLENKIDGLSTFKPNL